MRRSMGDLSAVTMLPNGALTALFSQYTDVTQRNRSQDYAFAFRHTGDPKSTTFTSELRYTWNRWAIDNLMWSLVPMPDASTGSTVPPAELDGTLMQIPALVWQTDYTHPFGTGTKLETGLKATSRATRNDLDAAYRDSAGGGYTPAPALGSAFDYHEQISAAYGVLSQRVRKVDAQLGLRLEQAATRLAVSNGERYRDTYGSAFPSAILAINPSPTRQLKASYSRRITRPDPFQLSPIGFREDPRNATRGNPRLRPEYTDALELTLQDARPWGSVQVNPYLRRTAHAVRFLRSVDSVGVSVGTFANVARTTTAGADVNVAYRRGPLNLFGGGGAFRYGSEAGALSTTTTVWSARANATWKLSPLTDVQAFASYRGPMKLEGGSQDAFVFTTFGVRRKLWGDRGSASLRFADPFSMARFGIETRNGAVIESSQRRYGMRGIFLSVNRSFGAQLKLRPRPQDESQTQLPGQGP